MNTLFAVATLGAAVASISIKDDGLLGVPMDVRVHSDYQWDLFSQYCEAIVYTSTFNEPKPSVDIDNVVTIERRGEDLIFEPDTNGTDCALYGVTPVRVVRKHHSFHVYSNVCGFYIFEGGEHVGSSWTGFDLTVKQHGSEDVTFYAEAPDHDCSLYNNVGGTNSVTIRVSPSG